MLSTTSLETIEKQEAAKVSQEEGELCHGQADGRREEQCGDGQPHHDGGGTGCSKRPLVTQGRAATASPPKMHTTHGTSGTHRINFKTISAKSPKPSKKKIAAF